MRRRRHKLQVSTFPFLAVLLCAMGALLLVLLVMDRRAHDAARARAEQAARLAAGEAAHDAEARRAAREQEREATLAARRQEHDAEHGRIASQDAEVQGKVRSMRDQVAQAAARLRAEQDEEATLKQKIDAEHAQGDAERQALVQVRVDEAKNATRTETSRKDLAEMTADLAQLERALADLKAAREREAKAYSVVPYNGKKGENRRPLYIECAGDQVIFHPDGLSLPEPRLATDLEGEVERRLARQKEQLPPDQASAFAPYLMLLVRPDGVISYYRVRDALRGLKIDFGYEFIDADWALDFPADDGTAPAPPWTVAAKPPAVAPSTTPPGRPLAGVRPGYGPEASAGSPPSANPGGDPSAVALSPGPAGPAPAGDPTGHGPPAPPGGPVPDGVRPGYGPGTPAGAGPSASPGDDPSGVGLFPGPTGHGPPAPPSGPGPAGVRPGYGPEASAGAPPAANPGGDPSGVVPSPGPAGPAHAGDPTGHGSPASPAGPGPVGERPGTQFGSLKSGTPGPGSASTAAGDDPAGPGPSHPGAAGSPPPVPGPSAFASNDPPGRAPASTPPHDAAPPTASAGPAPATPEPPWAPHSDGTASHSATGTQEAPTPSPAPPGSPGAPGAKAAPGGRHGASDDPDDDPFLRAPPPPLPNTAQHPPPSLRPARLSGDRDWIIYVECKPEGVVLYPTQLMIPASALARPSVSNPLLQSIQQLIDRKEATVRAGESSYRPEVRFLVHPNAGRTYHLAYPTLDALAAPKTAQDLQPEDDVSAIVRGH